MKLRVFLANLVLIGTIAFAAETGAELFQRAVTQERAAGNLEEAIKLYQRVATEFASNRALAAKALLQEAGCYEKLGQKKAAKLYEQVARDYRDQGEMAAEASARLTALREKSVATSTVAMTQRKIDLPFPSLTTFEIFQTDGTRELFKESPTGPLMISDLASENKRVVFKPKQEPAFPGIFYIPSRDLSMLFAAYHPVNQPIVFAVQKTDGTSYRELSLLSHRHTATPDWSWDNRYLFICDSHPDGTSELVRFAAASGEVYRTKAPDCALSRPSPNGRFIALAAAERQNFGKIFIMPSQGGEAQLVFDQARLLDWTRDGHYLLIDSAHAGTEAIFLLPVQDGHAAGDPIFIHNGPAMNGSVNPSGALIYRAELPMGGFAASLGSLDASGHLKNWQTLNLAPNSFGFSFDAKWSPNSSEILYLAPSEASRPDRWVVRTRNISTGEEREVYKGTGTERPNCIWAQKTPNLVCAQSHDLVTISVQSGKVERLSSLPPGGNGRFINDSDDTTLYFWREPSFEFTRWDLATQQETKLDRLTGFGQISSSTLYPSQHWMARRDKNSIEIRSTGGGEWKHLISLVPTQMTFTPDGKYVIYHDRDASGKQSLFRVSTAGGPPERVGDFPRATREGFMSVSPDGQKILVENRVAPELWMLQNFEPKQRASRP